MAEQLPAKVKRTLYRGDHRQWIHTFTEDDGTTPIDLTGKTFASMFRDDLDRGTVVCTATCTVTDGPAGELTEVLTSAEADKLPGQTDPDEKPTVYWDLQELDGGEATTWLYARCPVMGDVTDA